MWSTQRVVKVAMSSSKQIRLQEELVQLLVEEEVLLVA